MNIPKELTVSIIMPAYNAQRFLSAAVESILAQSFSDFEFLIMDDGSTDSTWQILQEYAEKDSRVKLFQQENQGVGVSLNYLISVAKGEFIARMDADDISHPERLQEQVNYFVQHLQTDIVSTGTTLIAPNGLGYCTICFPDNHNLLKEFFAKNKNPITHGAVMMKKSLLLNLNLPIYKSMRAQDLELWQRLIDKAHFGLIQKPLYFLRQYSGSITDRWHNKEGILSQQYQNKQHVENILSDLDNKLAMLLKPNLNPDEGYELFLNGRALFLNNHYWSAIKNFILAAIEDKKYRTKSLGLIGFVMLGKLGVYLYAKLRLNKNEYEQLPVIES